MKRNILNLILVLITGILVGQNSKPSFEIISANQQQKDDCQIASEYIESVLKDRGFVIFNKNESSETLQSDYSFTVSIKNAKDSLNLNFRIIENCWKKEITSINKTYSLKDFDIRSASVELCDEIFGSLMSHFSEMFRNGQIIKLTIKSSKVLNTEIKTKSGTQRLFDLINEYIQSQSLDKPQIIQQTDFELIYRLKIPMTDSKQNSITASSFGSELKKQLKKSAKLNADLTQNSLFNIELDL